MKHILIFALVALIVGTCIMLIMKPVIAPTPTVDTATTTASTTTPTVVDFTGVLEAVDTGCFSDGECAVTVSGKHVTLLIGWNQETVGTIKGVESIGDLENHIGEVITVHAKATADGQYTLYGDTQYYIEVSAATTIPTASSTVTNIDKNSCIVGGCSSQLCVDAAAGDAVSTCEYREEYACYATATCERQPTGDCGWTPTDTLTACIAKATQ
jgi:hypothetical protein